MLAARLESGDPMVRTDRVDDALYVAVGPDPYQLLGQVRPSPIYSPVQRPRPVQAPT